jgi:hypothetical protein
MQRDCRKPRGSNRVLIVILHLAMAREASDDGDEGADEGAGQRRNVRLDGRDPTLQSLRTLSCL